MSMTIRRPEARMVEIRSQVALGLGMRPVLYHASEWGREIVESGEIRGAPIEVREDLNHNRRHHGVTAVSTTRDMWFARMYAPCVFVLDHRLVLAGHRIVQRAEGAYGGG